MKWHQKMQNQFEMGGIGNILLYLQFESYFMVHVNLINFLRLFLPITTHTVFIIASVDCELIVKFISEVVAEQ